MTREQGYYWVKPNEKYNWEVAQWYPPRQVWWLTGCEGEYSDGDIFEIDERMLTR